MAFVAATYDFSLEPAPVGVWIVNADGSSPRELVGGVKASSVVWSPDGRRLAVVGTRDERELWVVDRSGGERVRLTPKTIGVSEVAWSPDGKELAVAECREPPLWCGLSVMAVRPEMPRRLTRPPTSAQLAEEDNGEVSQLHWSADGQRIAFAHGSFRQARVSIADPRTSTMFALGWGEDRWAPLWSPSGRSIAFATATGLGIAAPDGSSVRRVPVSFESFAWSADGTRLLILDSRRRLLSAPVTGGAPKPLRAPIAVAPHFQAYHAWSPDGRGVLVEGGSDVPPLQRGEQVAFLEPRVIHFVRPKGTTPFLGVPTIDADPVWSPDGRSIAFSRTRLGGRTAVYVMSADGGTARRLAGGARPKWSPDGRRIAVTDGESIRVVEIDTRRTRVVGRGGFDWVGDDRIAFVRGNGLWSVSSEGGGMRILTRVRHPLTGECEARVHGPERSPDGASIALFFSHTPGCGRRALTGIATAPSAGGPARVVHVHDGEALDWESLTWSPDGSMVVFLDVDAGWKAVGASGGLRPWPDVLGGSPAWAADGSMIAYVDFHSIYVLSTGSAKPRRLTRGGEDGAPQWEPR